jgi:gliding motility-associated-like protein
MWRFSLLISSLLCFSSIVFSQSTKSAFDVDYSKACVGGSISFTNRSTGSVSTSNWDFGDGVVYTSPGLKSTSHSFSNPGKYEVTLTIITSTGSTVETSRIIEVIPVPNLDFGIIGNKCEVPANLVFTNNSVKTDGITYSWNFGNGQSNSLYSPGTISYGSTGKITSTLSIVTNLPGCKVPSSSKTFQIYDFRATISGKDLFCAKVGTMLTAKATMPVDSYSWYFGDGTSGVDNDTVFPEFKKAGNFMIDLKIVNNAIQCESHSYYKVTSKPLPAPSFSVNTTKICPGFSVNFTNNSFGMTDYIWDFGDGTKYEGKDPGSHTFKAEGKMTVTLSSKSSNGCSGASVQKDLIEVANPIVKITADTTSGCSILPVKLTDLSTSNDEVNNPIKNWEWNFGDGKTYTGKDPAIVNYDVGKYDVKLKITTSQGCVVEKVFDDFIKIGKIDKVDFTSEQTSGCANSPMKFSNNSTIKSTHDQNELTFDWIFSDTSKNTGLTIFHRFNKDTGMISVKFYIHFRGCTDSLFKTDFFRVKPPLANFIPDTSLFCFNKNSLPYNVINRFSDISKLGKNGDDILVNWDFGNGSKSTVNNVNPNSNEKGSASQMYNDFGTYRVLQTTINNSTGCQDTISKLFHISWVIPKFEISVDSVCQYSTLQFKDFSYSFAKHPLVNYSFNSGEGTSISGQNVNYAYNNYGKMFVSNKPVNKVGCSTSIKDSLIVIKLPNADIISDLDSTCAPGSVLYSNNSKVTGNARPFKMFYWYVQNKNTIDSTSDILYTKNLAYNSVGKYFVTLKSKDIFGCVSKIDTVWVVLSKPESNLDFKSVVCNNTDFKLYNKTKNWVNNSWMMDDVFIGKDKDSVKYQFNDNKNEGIFKNHVLTLISLDKKKCVDTLQKIITVSMPRPKVNVSFKNLVDTTKQYLEFKCPPLTSNYFNISESIGKIDSSIWVFSKNSKSTLSNPLKIYSKPGLYSTYLRTVDEYNCSTDTMIKDFLKINGPVGYPVWSGMGDVCGQLYKFEIKNMDKVSSVKWDMGDGTILNDSIIFKHRYPGITAYKPTVTLVDFENCKVTYLMEEPDTLIIIPETGMDAQFTLSSNEIKLGQSLYIKEHSISPNQPIIKWKWNFDFPTLNLLDSTEFSLPFSIKYSKYGTKNILLTITDKDNCSDQQIIKVNVIKDYDMPNVFTPNNDGQNDNFELFDTIFKSYELHLFNRWGNKVYELNNGNGIYLWDGTNKSKTPMDNGEYFYYLVGEFEDGTYLKKNGNVTLISN